MGDVDYQSTLLRRFDSTTTESWTVDGFSGSVPTDVATCGTRPPATSGDEKVETYFRSDLGSSWVGLLPFIAAL